MLNAWYIPSSTGDFRLEADGDGSKLTVENPTPAELERCESFMKRCRQWKWLQDLGATIATEGRTEIDIKVPVAKCGKHLAKGVMPARGTLTAIRSADGEIICTADHTESASKVTKAAASKSADKAVTVKRPTTCCPVPVEGPLKRSSRVLREFCTPSQWADWVKYGVLHCIGGTTGNLYRLVHRHHPLAAKQGKICWSVDDNSKLHFWDWSVPPAEEVLSAKLILENREIWLRNMATLLTASDGSYVRPPPNPLGTTLDGTWDASFFRNLGSDEEYDQKDVAPLDLMGGLLAISAV